MLFVVFVGFCGLGGCLWFLMVLVALVVSGRAPLVHPVPSDSDGFWWFWWFCVVLVVWVFFGRAWHHRHLSLIPIRSPTVLRRYTRPFPLSSTIKSPTVFRRILTIFRWFPPDFQQFPEDAHYHLQAPANNTSKIIKNDQNQRTPPKQQQQLRRRRWGPPTIRFYWFLSVLVVLAVCCGFWWFWFFFARASWGTPYHFPLISITSPTVPLGYFCHVLWIQSDFLHFPKGAPTISRWIP